MSFDRTAFDKERKHSVESMAKDAKLQKSASRFVEDSNEYDHAYNWTWLGLPIIQLPEDILIAQEIIWKAKPSLIIETGVAWGGGVVFHAAILELIGAGRVIAVDSCLPKHVQQEIYKYRFSNRINLVEGNSTNSDVYCYIKSLIKKTDSVCVFLDSNHSHEHVLRELELYGDFVTPGQHMIVYATAIDTIRQPQHRSNRPWGAGNSPLSALNEYLTRSDDFEIDDCLDSKLLCSFVKKGLLKRRDK